jgi:DNA-binding NarL/FixJ family response regulator
MNTVRVALAEDNVLLREGMSRLVAANNDFELVGVACDLPQLLALVAEQAPDVVVTDIRMPPTGTDEGIKAASWVREHYPRTGVVVLSQYVAPVVDELVKARAAEHSSGLSLLTARESQILGEMAQGKSNSAIAAALYVTERAVEKHTNSIFAKLGLSEEKDVNRRVKAVLVFLSHQGANGP